MRWRTRGDLRSEDGFTLVELMASMAVFSIAVTAISAVLFSVQRDVQLEAKLATSVDDARLAFRSFDREMRSALAVATASSGMALNVYTMNNYDARGGASCYQWRLTGTNLEGRWWPYPAPAGSKYPWRLVAANVRNAAPTDGSAAVPLFSIDPSAQFAGRLVTFAILANSDPKTSANPDGQRIDTRVETSIAGRNIVSVQSNPCTVAANQPASS